MEEFSWLEELTKDAAEDPWCQTCLAKTAALEAEYQRIRDTLSEEDRDSLDRYIAACEELDRAECIVAYNLGKNHSIRSIPKLQQKASG